MAAAVATMPPLPASRAIPDGVRASVRSWWAVNSKGSEAAEERLLRRLPYFLPAGTPLPSPAPPVTARAEHVAIDPSSPKKFINTVSFLPGNPAPPHAAPAPSVVLHGYGAGLGFYFANFDTLGQWAARRGAPVYLLDWLGMGRSARVPFTIKSKKDDIDGRVHEAESFFVDSLEQWRVKMDLPKMTLVGHSLGGRVERLVLLSPAGIPRAPEDTSVPAAEVDPSPHGSKPAHSASDSETEKIARKQRRAQLNQSTTRRVFTHLWEEGYSPFGVVRALGMFGPLLVGRYSSRRFSGLSEEETRDMHDYIYNITVAKGSGEYCISHLLAPGAHARRPMVDRIDKLKIPVTFVYGDHDWMDVKGGEESVRRLKAAGNQHARTVLIPDAGHHVYLDNPSAVNQLLVRELDKTVPRQ
ncbi:alpha/beta-hydrolase [Auriculariales sp. MPI-PUGE-AT-0066]|nr:alpha/beta-hydrolase [Auriculariales sp. MPI-PUGE-AT-0066]